MYDKFTFINFNVKVKYSSIYDDLVFKVVLEHLL